MQDKSNTLSIETVRSKLNARFDSLNEKQDKTKEEKAFTSYNWKQFKGTCRGCGKYGHKQVNCPKSKGGDASSSEKNMCWRDPLKQFTCNYCKEPGHFVRNFPKLKKKNKKEKSNLATEKKVDDDEKFDELYIDEVGLRCEAEEVKKRVQLDNKVEYILIQQEKLSKKTVRFQHNIVFEASTQQFEKRAILQPDQGTSKVPTSILRTKKTNEKCMKCTIDG